LDALLAKAQHTLNGDARAALLRQTSRLAMADHGLVPLHFTVANWATPSRSRAARKDWGRDCSGFPSGGSDQNRITRRQTCLSPVTV
jgi:hypothetical protein